MSPPKSCLKSPSGRTLAGFSCGPEPVESFFAAYVLECFIHSCSANHPICSGGVRGALSEEELNQNEPKKPMVPMVFQLIGLNVSRTVLRLCPSAYLIFVLLLFRLLEDSRGQSSQLHLFHRTLPVDALMV